MWRKGRFALDEKLYNYEECERIWRRVAPDLTPYPQVRREEVGEEMDPCCMGTEAMVSVEVLQGFVYVECCTKRRFARLAARTQSASLRQLFSDFSALASRREKKLRSALYLITGEVYCAELSCGSAQWDSWCAMLRSLYHDAACNAFNYDRAAQEATDSCLTSLLSAFAQEEYRRAECILDLLAKAL